MNNSISTEYKFTNKVTGAGKLEKYTKQLQELKKVMESMPRNMQFDANFSKSLETTNKLLEKLNKNVNGFKKSVKSSLGKVSQPIDKASDSTKSFASRLKDSVSHAKKLTTAFSVIKFAAVLKVFGTLTQNISKFTNKSAEYVENLNLMNVAFHRTETGINRANTAGVKFVNTLSEMYGLDESNLTRTVGLFKQLANAMGLSDEVGTKLTETLTRMSIDISSLYNVSFERATSALQSALSGQTKPIRGLTGADITQSTLEVTLKTYGIDKAVSDLSYVEKRLIIITSLLGQLEEAQNDFGKTIESVSNQMKIFNEQVDKLTRNLGSVFLPILQKILPYLNAVLMVLAELVGWLAIFFGFDEDEFAGFAGVTDSALDLEDALSEANDSAKKLKQGLRGFDKLNVITTPSKDKSGSSGGRIDPKVLDAFNQAVKEYEERLQNVEMKATKIRDAIMEWLGFTKQVNEETNKITWQYNYTGEGLEEMAQRMASDLAKKLNDITNNIDWDGIGENLGKGITFALTFINTFVDEYEWEEIGSKIASFLNNAIANINWKQVGKTLTNKLTITLKSLVGFLKTFDFKQFGDSIKKALQGINWKEIFGLILEALGEVLKGIGDFIEGLGLDTILIGVFSLLAFKIGKNFASSLISNITGSLSGLGSTNLFGKKDKSDDNIGGTSNTPLPTVGSGFSDMLSSLGEAGKTIALLGGLALVLNELSDALQTFADTNLSLGETLGFIGGNFAILVLGITALAEVMKLIDIESTIELVAILVSFAVVLESVSTVLESLGASGLTVGESLEFMGGIVALITGLITALTVATQFLQSPTAMAGLLVLTGSLSAILTVLSLTLPTILEACEKFIKGIAPVIQTTLIIIGNLIENIIIALGTTLPPIITAVGSLFNTIFNGVSKVVSTVGDVIVKIMKEAGRLIDNVLDSILDFINELGPAINNFVDNAIEAVTKLINFLISGIEYMINTLIIDAINGLLNKVNDNAIAEFFGVDIPTLKKVKIERFTPRLKTGMDFVPSDYYGPVYLDYGERVLTKEENEEYSQNKSASAINTYSGNAGSNNNKQPQIIQIYLDRDKKLAEYTLDQLIDMAGDNGKPIEIGA